MSGELPRVLFVTPNAFNSVTGTGVTFSNLFRGWPRDRIATATEDTVPVTRDVCERYYFLTSREMPKVWPVSMLQRGPRGEAAAGQAGAGPSKRPMRWLLGEAGVPNRGRMSKPLRAWVDAFRPEVVLTIGGSLGTLDLTSEIGRQWGAAVVVHLMDEGETDPIRSGIFGGHIRRAYRKRLTALVAQASGRMAICEAMAREYEGRFGHAFTAFQNAVDLGRWGAYRKRSLEVGRPARIVYVGSILPQSQLASLKELAATVGGMHEGTEQVRLEVYTGAAMAERYRGELALAENVTVGVAPADDEAFFTLIRDADALVLPVNFDAESVRYIRLSMPTKVPSYLTVGTPILLYGPRGVAQVDYAAEAGWGHVVDRPERAALREGVLRVLRDEGLRRALHERAMETVAAHHDAAKVRGRFQAALVAAAAGRG